MNSGFFSKVGLSCHWHFVVLRLEKNTQTTTQSKLICVPCDMCGLSGLQQATLLLVALSRSFLPFLFLCQGMSTVALLLDLVSLFTTPGAQVTPLPASYGNILTHLSLEIRLVARFEMHKFTLKYVSAEFCHKVKRLLKEMVA